MALVGGKLKIFPPRVVPTPDLLIAVFKFFFRLVIVCAVFIDFILVVMHS